MAQGGETVALSLLAQGKLSDAEILEVAGITAERLEELKKKLEK